MTVRGIVIDATERTAVATDHGERTLAEVTVRPDRGAGEPTTVTLWGSWAETAEHLQAGMELLVTDPNRTQYHGETEYATTGDSYVVVEPDRLVTVTDVRQWVQCPRLYYLGKLSGVPLKYPVVKGTVVHEVFGDLLRGRDRAAAIDERIEAVGLQLGLLGYDAATVREEVDQHARAIEGWLRQGTLTDPDSWRSEQSLVSETYGLKGRADAIRRGMPVELKTGKNTNREPRFQDKIQAAAYALLLQERGVPADTGVLLYTKNAALDRHEESGDLSPAKEFSIGRGLLEYVVRARNELVAIEYDTAVPTGYTGDTPCEYCFEQDTCRVVSGRLDQRSKAGQVGRPLPEAERRYFERFYAAIEAERRAIHGEYAKLWRQSARERADDDRALIDLEPVGRTERPGGRWALRARRSTDAVSKIREGDLVLASDGDPIHGQSELARVETLGEEVVVATDEPIELRRLDVYPTELSADRMLEALYDALLKGNRRRKDVLFGRADPAFGPVEGTFVDNNAAQDEAVRLAVGAEDCALVHGPPGTGKTYTIARAIEALVERGERVLLSAFTNRAVDNALAALRERDGSPESVVRVGTEHGVREDMQDLRLERAGDPEKRATELESASVVAATTSSCGSNVMATQSFDVAVVDEAGQLTEPGTLAPLNLADRFVLVGDHQQLPPVVQAADGDAGSVDGDATNDGAGPTGTGETGAVDGAAGGESAAVPAADLTRSLFERLIDRYPDAGVMLDRQYRMAQRIQAFPSRAFYDGKLRPATAEVAARSVGDLPGVDPSALPPELRDRVAFLDVDGDEGRHTDRLEAERVADVIDAYTRAGLDRGEIGVIAPFRAQVAEIARRVPDDVTVDTVDRFQGSSEEVVVVSFVATDDIAGPIFEDYRRANVALTRAKRALVLVGTADALRTDETYARMVEWANG